MTKALPAGTCNVPMNLLSEQRSILGRLAFKLGISQSHLCELLIGEKLKDLSPADAQAFAAASKTRNRHRVQIFANILFATLITISFLTGQPIRRASRTVQVVRVARRNELTA